MNPSASSTKLERTCIAPLLNVRRGREAIEFYKRALGAIELLRVEDDRGEVVARMSVDGAVFWLADEAPAQANFSPESLQGGSVRIIVVTEDPDSLFTQAIAAGATVVSPVDNQSYGWRVGRLVDPFGHHWEIGKPLNCG